MSQTPDIRTIQSIRADAAKPDAPACLAVWVAFVATLSDGSEIHLIDFFTDEYTIEREHLIGQTVQYAKDLKSDMDKLFLLGPQWGRPFRALTEDLARAMTRTAA